MKELFEFFYFREDAEREIILTNALEIHFINMVKYRKQGKVKLDGQCFNDPLFRWLAWFDKNSPPEILEEVIKMDTAIKTADSRMIQIVQLMEDEEMRLAYDRYMKYECDRTSEINFARCEGREESAREIALNLLAKGSTPEFVQEITGLDMQTIQKFSAPEV